MKRTFILLTIVLALASCTVKDIFKTNLNVSVSSYCFDYQAKDSLVVDVFSEQDWTFTVEGEPQWLTVNRLGENQAVVKVTPNEGGEERRASIIFTSGEYSEVLNIEQSFYVFDKMFYEVPLGNYGCISRNGRYLAYVGVTIDGPNEYQAILLDIETGDKTVLEGIPLDYDLPVFYNQIYAVSDDGSTIAFGSALSTRSAIYRNGELYELELPTDRSYSHATAQGLSDDGNIVVGWCRVQGKQQCIPCMWKNNMPIVLEYPEKLLNGNDNISGAMARGCSADGSVIYGSTWQQGEVMIWRNMVLDNISKETAEEVNVKGTKVTNSLFMEMHTNAISPNGRYLTCAYQKWSPSGYAIRYPAYVDLETNETFIMEDKEDARFVHATDTGLIFGQASYRIPFTSFVYDAVSGTVVSQKEWINDVFGIDFTDSRFILQVSSDCKTLYGFNQMQGTAGQTINQYWCLRQ